MKNHWNSAYMKKWIISVALPVLILLIPTTESFTPVLRMYLAITLWSIMAFAFELLNNMATSLLLLFGYGLTGVCSLTVPLSVFSTESVWITLCALALVTLIQKTHILERLAYTLSDKVGGSYVGIVYAVAVFSLLARLLLQGALAGVAALAVAYGISSALGYGKSKASAGILLTSAFVYLDSNYFLYSPDYIAVAYNGANEVTSISTNYMNFFLDNAVHIIPLVLSVAATAWICKPEEKMGEVSFFKEKLKELGKWEAAEKRMLCILLALTVYLFTSRWHGLGMVYGFVAALALAFVPGMELGDKSDLGKINWGAWLFVGACMSIGVVGAKAGFGTFISGLALPYMKGMTNIPFMAVSYLLAVVLNFIMTPAAILSLLGAPLAQICVDYGLSVQAAIHMIYQGGSQLIFCYEASLYMIAFSFGMMKNKDVVKVMSLKFVIQTIGTFTIGLVWWHLRGII